MINNIFIIAIKINPDLQFEQYMYLFDTKVCNNIMSYRFRKDQLIAFTSALLKNHYLRYYLNINNIDIAEDTYHRPFIHGLSHKVDFNISHSGNYVIMAVATNLRIGIDIEMINHEIDYRNLAPTVFSQSECFLANSVSKFFILWTKKEAMLKCIGHGFLEDTYLYSELNHYEYQYYQQYQLYVKKIEDYYLSICVKDEDLNMEGII